jgi:enediyne polyketide synthase
MEREIDESFDKIATRIWAADECLRKAGVIVNVPLTRSCGAADGWLTLTVGQLNISTFIMANWDTKSCLAMAFLTKFYC